jgi:hypothetical protein
MTQERPITPPPELVLQWFLSAKAMPVDQWVTDVATQAARWGADQELEACCEWLDQNTGRWDLLAELRAARRPKPPSQAEEALIALEQTVTLLMPVTGSKKIERFDTIRTALKRLRELERTVAD